jgi:hypothetical protein
MSKLSFGVVAATILIASSAIGSKTEAAVVMGVPNLPFTNSYSLVEKVRRCVCGPNGCTCGRRYRRGYEYDHHYGLRSYPRHYGYPRPGCTFALREYQRRWPYQLWPPSMRCFPYPY